MFRYGSDRFARLILRQPFKGCVRGPAGGDGSEFRAPALLDANEFAPGTMGDPNPGAVSTIEFADVPLEVTSDDSLVDVGAIETDVTVPHPTVVVLAAGPVSRHMLAQRIASSRHLNCPKAIARRKRPTVSATKPIRKRDVAPARPAKVRRQALAPRVLIPARATATILPFTGSPIRDGGEGRETFQTAKVA